MEMAKQNVGKNWNILHDLCLNLIWPFMYTTNKEPRALTN